MDGNGIPMDKAELLSTLLECILYGFSLLMFGGTIWSLGYRRHIHQVNMKMVAVACSLLLFSTVHLIIDLIRIMQGLILYRDTYPGGPSAFFSDVSQWTFVSKNIVYVVESLIGDGVILYRCYVIWQNKLVMILPALLWCGAGVTGFGAASKAAHVSSFDPVVPWVQSFYAMTFSTNLLAISLLTYRIWSHDRIAAHLRHYPNHLRKIVCIIIDAGAIYNITILAVWICLSLNSNGQFVILDMITPIISIAFYMVIIRVGLLEYAPRSLNVPTTEMQVRITTWTENKVDDVQSSGTVQQAE